MELLVVLAIVALMSAIGVPYLRLLSERQEAQNLQSQVIAAIRTAQQYARALRKPVVLCATQDFKTCTTEPVLDLMSFVDDYGDGQMHESSQILHVQQNGKHGQLHWRTFPRYRDYLLFNANGFLHSDNGTIWYTRTAAETDPIWKIILSKSGRIRNES